MTWVAACRRFPEASEVNRQAVGPTPEAAASQRSSGYWEFIEPATGTLARQGAADDRRSVYAPRKWNHLPLRRDLNFSGCAGHVTASSAVNYAQVFPSSPGISMMPRCLSRYQSGSQIAATTQPTCASSSDRLARIPPGNQPYGVKGRAGRRRSQQHMGVSRGEGLETGRESAGSSGSQQTAWPGSGTSRDGPLQVWGYPAPTCWIAGLQPYR